MLTAPGRSASRHRAHAPHGAASRQLRWAERESVESLTFGLASATDVLDAAFRLVHDQYVSRGYMDAHPSGRRLSLHHALPTTKVFVACKGADVVGTVSLIQDSLLGLPMDEIYRDEVSTLRRANRCVAEVSALAIRSECRALGLPILLALIRMLVAYAAELARLDDLCIAVNPRHVDFYQKAFTFRVLGPLRGYQKVNGAPAVALSADLDFIRALGAARSGDRHPDSDLRRLLFAPPQHAAVMRRLSDDLPWSVLTPEQFHHFFANHESLTQAPPPVLALLRFLYPGRTLASMASSQRSETRPHA